MAWTRCQAMVISSAQGARWHDLRGSAAPATDETGGGVRDAVAQRLRLCPVKVAVQASSFSQASRMQAIMDTSSQVLFSP